jgi:hypothetical protein
MIVIVIAILVLAAAIIVGLKIWSGESEPESESEVQKDAKQLVERACAIQQQYWTPNPDEKKRLLMKGIDDLAWDEALRLLHLACLEILSDGPCREQLVNEEILLEEPLDAPPGDNRDLIMRLVTRLRSEASPYKARHVAVWQGEAGGSDQRKADLEGIFINASLTHLGCIEVIRFDSEQQPAELTFISLDEIRGAVFASPALFRSGKFFFDDGRPDEIVLVPLLYGISWLSPINFDQDGTATRFICAMETEEGKPAMTIGVGHQDFVIERDGQTLFGLGSIGELMVAIFVDDPKFDRKCKARGLDPKAVRQSMIKKK